MAHPDLEGWGICLAPLHRRLRDPAIGSWMADTATTARPKSRRRSVAAADPAGSSPPDRREGLHHRGRGNVAPLGRSLRLQPNAGDRLATDAGLIDLCGPDHDRAAIQVRQGQVGGETVEPEAIGLDTLCRCCEPDVLAAVDGRERHIRFKDARELFENKWREVIKVAGLHRGLASCKVPAVESDAAPNLDRADCDVPTIDRSVARLASHVDATARRLAINLTIQRDVSVECAPDVLCCGLESEPRHRTAKRGRVRNGDPGRRTGMLEGACQLSIDLSASRESVISPREGR